MKERIAFVDGIRTPFCKAMGIFSDYDADDLGAFIVRELIERSSISPDQIDELIVGNVINPPHAYNVSRVIGVKGGLPISVPAITVSRNCASGMEALVLAAERILRGDSDIIVAGGAESMTHVPVMFNNKAKDWFYQLSKAKKFSDRLKLMMKFRLSFLSPVVPAIADPLCGLTMGETAEILAKEFGVTREEQDEYALSSQHRSHVATEEQFFKEEILPIPLSGKKTQLVDDGVRADQSYEQLAKLKPAFNRMTGTVTAGNSSQVTDGAAMFIMMRESKAKELGIEPIGYLTGYAYAGLDPSRMGLGPVFATEKLLRQTGLKLNDFDLVEINEAFAAQVIAVTRAMNSDTFCQKNFNRNALGEIDRKKLNVNGGAIALGHPLGASGARITLTLLKELKRKGKQRGLATLCVGGGQGQAISVEV